MQYHGMIAGILNKLGKIGVIVGFCLGNAILTYIFYKIFANSITVIKEYGIKKAFTVEEVIGASLLVAIAFYSLHGLNIFGLSISNILSIMIVLFLGWKNGMLVGATSGITIGMVLRHNRKFKSSISSFICNITE